MLVNVFNLPLYVIGGGVVSGWDLFAPRMFEELRRLSYIYGLTQPQADQPFTAGKTYVVPAATGPDAGCWERPCCPTSKPGGPGRCELGQRANARLVCTEPLYP
jgi:hypothetical protein